MHPTVIVALISGVAAVTVAILQAISAKRKHDSASTMIPVVIVLPTESENTASYERLEALERRVDRLEIHQSVATRRINGVETQHLLQG